MTSAVSALAGGSKLEPLEGTWIAYIPPLTEPELKRLWAELCRYEPDATIPTGPISSVLRRLWKFRPNNLERDEFMRTVLDETCIRFMKYYNSSFMPPMDRWLYKQAWSATQDFIKHWVPGFRYDPKYKPAGFVCFDDVQDQIDAQSPQFQLCEEWQDLVIRGVLRDETLTDAERHDAVEHCCACEACCRLLARCIFILEHHGRPRRATTYRRALAHFSERAQMFWTGPSLLPPIRMRERLLFNQRCLPGFETIVVKRPRDMATAVFFRDPSQNSSQTTRCPTNGRATTQTERREHEKFCSPVI